MCVCVCVYACVCVCMCMRACARMCECACVHYCNILIIFALKREIDSLKEEVKGIQVCLWLRVGLHACI